MTTSRSRPEGYVYIVAHPAFPGWVKIGQTLNPTDRLRKYNTGDPDRSYRMLVAIPTSDRRHAEWLTHQRLISLGYMPQGEWFQVAPATAESTIKKAVALAEEQPLFG